jgi:hypothetical protein
MLTVPKYLCYHLDFELFSLNSVFSKQNVLFLNFVGNLAIFLQIF